MLVLLSCFGPEGHSQSACQLDCLDYKQVWCLSYRQKTGSLLSSDVLSAYHPHPAGANDDGTIAAAGSLSSSQQALATSSDFLALEGSPEELEQNESPPKTKNQKFEPLSGSELQAAIDVYPFADLSEGASERGGDSGSESGSGDDSEDGDDDDENVVSFNSNIQGCRIIVA